MVVKYLQMAVNQAVYEAEWDSAIELIRLAQSREAKPTEEKQLEIKGKAPARRKAITCKYRSYQDWIKIITESYFPALREKRTETFTRINIYAWIERNPDITLSESEKEVLSKGTRWKYQVSTALHRMVKAGHLGKRWSYPGSHSVYVVPEAVES